MLASGSKIKDLEWALSIYSDLVKFGLSSRMLEHKENCFLVLEDFEEYEKCSDLKKIFADNPEGLLKKISKKK